MGDKKPLIEHEVAKCPDPMSGFSDVFIQKQDFASGQCRY